MVLYVKDGLRGKPVKLIDLNGKKDSNIIAIDYWQDAFTNQQKANFWRFLCFLGEYGIMEASVGIMAIPPNPFDNNSPTLKLRRAKSAFAPSELWRDKVERPCVFALK